MQGGLRVEGNVTGCWELKHVCRKVKSELVCEKITEKLCLVLCPRDKFVLSVNVIRSWKHKIRKRKCWKSSAALKAAVERYSCRVNVTLQLDTSRCSDQTLSTPSCKEQVGRELVLVDLSKQNNAAMRSSSPTGGLGKDGTQIQASGWGWKTQKDIEIQMSWRSSRWVQVAVSYGDVGSNPTPDIDTFWCTRHHSNPWNLSPGSTRATDAEKQRPPASSTPRHTLSWPENISPFLWLVYNPGTPSRTKLCVYINCSDSRMNSPPNSER